MRPERIEHRRGKGLAIIHRCVRCGRVRANRIASDTNQADDIGTLAVLMRAAPCRRPAPLRGTPRPPGT